MMNQYISKMEGSASIRSMQTAAELKRKGVPIIKACGGVPVVVPLTDKNDYKIERKIVEDRITDRTKMRIINYPDNPTERILHQEKAEILRNLIFTWLQMKLYLMGKNISLASFIPIFYYRYQHIYPASIA